MELYALTPPGPSSSEQHGTSTCSAPAPCRHVRSRAHAVPPPPSRALRHAAVASRDCRVAHTHTKSLAVSRRQWARRHNATKRLLWQGKRAPPPHPPPLHRSLRRHTQPSCTTDTHPPHLSIHLRRHALSRLDAPELALAVQEPKRVRERFRTPHCRAQTLDRRRLRARPRPHRRPHQRHLPDRHPR